MTLPIVHHRDYTTDLPDGHRFPMRKFRRVYELIKQRFEPARIQVHRPGQIATDQIQSVHAPEYVESFRKGTLSSEDVRTIGLPWSEGLVNRTLRAVSGTVATVDLALETGLACNTAGGTHHAGFDRGAGFCIFNDLAVAAHHTLTRHGRDSVLILDCDVHQGNGTARIFDGDSRVQTISIHCRENYPFDKVTGTRDVDLPAGTGDDRYLEVLEQELNRARDQFKTPDLVLYDAGVDVHREDRLGQLELTTGGIRDRDRTVIGHFRDRGIPVAAVIGGGYDRDLDRLAHRHVQLHEAALEINSGVS